MSLEIDEKESLTNTDTHPHEITDDDTVQIQEMVPQEEIQQQMPVSTDGNVDDSYCTDEESFFNTNSDDDYQPPISIQIAEQPRRTSTRNLKTLKIPDFVYHTNFEADSLYEDPSSVNEALQSIHSDLWKQAMESEYQSLMKNNTWELVDLPVNKKPISNKWVFKTKRDAAGRIIKHKARLVIRGCAQKPGIDFTETYSPVVRYSSIRFLLAMAAKYDLEIHQMDAVTAFLQSELEDTIYMVQPECFQYGKKVCHLKKSLYGLKQASRIWNQHLDTQLKNSGMTQSSVDTCIYFRTVAEKIITVAVYVDDLILFSNDLDLMAELKKNLMRKFQMEDIGEAKYVLGMKIERNRKEGKVSICQEGYINDVLRKFNMTDCNPVATPLDAKQILSKEMSPKNVEDSEKMKHIPYQEAIGSLLYAAQVTRPDICYAVNKLSQFNQNPGMAHWNATKRVMRYLKGTSSFKLEFSKNSNADMIGYCDSDWAGDPEQRRSTTGYVFAIQGGPISWNSKRQCTVALSTTEAEYMSMVAATQEGLWLNKLQCEIFPDTSIVIKLNCDNKSAISLSATNTYHPRTKHIDVKYHFIKELVMCRRLEIEYISTKQMIADVLTKALPKQQHHNCSKAMGLQK